LPKVQQASEQRIGPTRYFQRIEASSLQVTLSPGPIRVNDGKSPLWSQKRNSTLAVIGMATAEADPYAPKKTSTGTSARTSTRRLRA